MYHKMIDIFEMECSMQKELFGARLRVAMEKKGITQSVLAAETGMDQGQISRYVRGLVEPSVSQVVRLAQVVSVPVEYLICDDTDEYKSMVAEYSAIQTGYMMADAESRLAVRAILHRFNEEIEINE